MILADSSIWIDHFRGRQSTLAPLLVEEQIVMHPGVIGEFDLGSLKNRRQVLHDLQLLPQIAQASDHEIMEWIERRRVFGKGIGWLDAHLLLSCILSGTELWTNDKPLASVARSCGAKNFIADEAVPEARRWHENGRIRAWPQRLQCRCNPCSEIPKVRSIANSRSTNEERDGDVPGGGLLRRRRHANIHP
jgi:hypothetical protein